jgi:plastocyanin
MKRSAATVFALVSLALFTACGGDEPEEDASTAPETSESESSEPETSESESESESGEATVLLAMVGTEADPDAFEISLTDEAGEPVTELPAGDYTIQVNDPSAMHNFHLAGGSIDESTTVEEVTEVTWDVTLEPGDYTYVCDPHPPMSGEFTVT